MKECLERIVGVIVYMLANYRVVQYCCYASTVGIFDHLPCAAVYQPTRTNEKSVFSPSFPFFFNRL